MVELADTSDSKFDAVRRGGSNPLTRTINILCPCRPIGRVIRLKIGMLRVRVSLRAPNLLCPVGGMVDAPDLGDELAEVVQTHNLQSKIRY